MKNQAHHRFTQPSSKSIMEAFNNGRPRYVNHKYSKWADLPKHLRQLIREWEYKTF